MDNVEHYIFLLTKYSDFLENLSIDYTIANAAINLNGDICVIGDLLAIKKASEKSNVEIVIKGKNFMEISTLTDLIDYFRILADNPQISVSFKPGYLLLFPNNRKIIKVKLTQSGLRKLDKIFV